MPARYNRSIYRKCLEWNPDFSSLPPNLHPKIVEMLERCLEKEAKNRYSGISDARVDIQKVLEGSGGGVARPVTPEEAQTKPPRMLSWITAAFVVGAIIAGVAVWMLRPVETKRVVRFDYDLPDEQVFTREGGTLAAVSPDGTKIVYVANRQLYIRKLNELTARPIQGTNQDPANPFFSPDGQWVAYYSVVDKQLKKIAISGGVPVRLCDIPVVTTSMSKMPVSLSTPTCFR